MRERWMTRSHSWRRLTLLVIMLAGSASPNGAHRRIRQGQQTSPLLQETGLTFLQHSLENAMQCEGESTW